MSVAADSVNFYLSQQWQHKQSTGSSPPTILKNNMSSTPTLSNSPSGSLNVESKAPSTSKVTSSSKQANAVQDVQKLLEGVPTWHPDEEAKLTALLTARKKAVELLAPGVSENQLWHPDSSNSSLDSGTGQPSGRQRSKTSTRTRATDPLFSKLHPGSSLGAGGTSVASTSSAKLARENPHLSMTLSGTTTFTLLQVKRLCGSTAMLGSAFFLLTSLKEQLAVKHSYESWMAILTMVQSKAVSSVLNGLLSSFAQTSTSTLGSVLHSSDDSIEEDSSELSDDEEILGTIESLNSSEELSGEEEEYRYSKRARQQARQAWISPSSSQNEFSHSDSGW